MSVSPRVFRVRVFRLAAGLTAGTLPLLALTLSARPSPQNASPLPSSQTPQQVAETLDAIVQPRFQQNAGRFGVDRVVHLEGHEQVSWIDPNNRSEARQFAAVKASHRSYALAFLHCVHKPGAHVDPPTPAAPVDHDFKPSVEALIAVGGTQAGADRTFQWANKALGPVVLPYLDPLKHGHPVQTDYENWTVVMRPVRALQASCLSCHAGAHSGDTLGVMVYAVDKNAKIKGKSFSDDGGEGGPDS